MPDPGPSPRLPHRPCRRTGSGALRPGGTGHAPTSAPGARSVRRTGGPRQLPVTAPGRAGRTPARTVAVMALLHRATVRPSKLELLAGWVPDRPWGAAAAGAELEQLGAYR